MENKQVTPTSVVEYKVRIPKSKRDFNIMKFNGTDISNFKDWKYPHIVRENNQKVFNTNEEKPLYGKGSQFGQKQRNEAFQKKLELRNQSYKASKQPLLLTYQEDTALSNESGKSKEVKKKNFKGIRDGGVSDNAAWYVFVQGFDKTVNAYPVKEWYNFQSINRYKTLSAEEAETRFEKRANILNHFSVMYEKRLNADNDDEEKENKSKDTGFKLSELDEWMSDRESGEDDDMENEEKEHKPEKKNSKTSKRKGIQGHKKKKNLFGENDSGCDEESDEYDNGAEHDYISGDSSDSEQENDDKVTKDLAGVEENKGLKNLLASDSEEENEEDKENSEKEIKNDTEKEEKKKGSGGDFTDSSDEENNPSKARKTNSSKLSNSEILKRKMLSPSYVAAPAAKKMKTEAAVPLLEKDPHLAVLEENIRRYLLRKPMTAADLLVRLRSKKSNHSSEQLVAIIAEVLKKINPTRKLIRSKMYFSL